MSFVLLDTHVLVWLIQGVDRLSPAKRERIQQAANRDELGVAAITPWEIAILTAKGRLALPMDVGEWINATAHRLGITVVPLSPEISVASNRLPGDFHADPADRMIVVTARHLNALLVTEVHTIFTYAQAGYVQAVSAS
ncbi:type II toxin-antitoxin system VapC family toxin [Asticcacaulis sp. AC402]|uniref:type II toxin-antitoxin system VapC family toxin n=1 Tax=Asticcacaulis sp. AC402 TaxID=1282361 RepID=UPI0003C4076F|nr:type II toxin-antitoxin system VapC family toxin [Asticcacaulis sp. AC402]ESQ75825.1 twitching motility protein PilT [Asticcacaulis sp. AC402]